MVDILLVDTEGFDARIVSAALGLDGGAAGPATAATAAKAAATAAGGGGGFTPACVIFESKVVAADYPEELPPLLGGLAARGYESVCAGDGAVDDDHAGGTIAWLLGCRSDIVARRRGG